jgi:succinoglycan biosynthesis protein ExoA
MITPVHFLFVSILIPIRNEAAYIERCLQAVLDQDYPPEQIEILIADGMSDDETRLIIGDYQQTHKNIRLIDNPGKIVPTGLNIAILQAKGDIIIRVDGHTLIAPDYAKRCVETLMRTDADNVGGCMTAVGTTAFGKVVAVATSVPFGVGNSRFHYSDKEEEVDSVYMGAWPSDVFKRVGLFDEELVRDQDDEFNYRLREKGGKIILNPEIKSVYTVRSSPKLLFKQYFQYGYWKVRVLQKHPRQMSLRQFIPPLFVMGLIAALIMAMIIKWGWLLLIGYTGLYLVANLAASMLTAYQKGWKYFWSLPVAFATIHVSYGAGFLVGLMKFWHRWGR